MAHTRLHSASVPSGDDLREKLETTISTAELESSAGRQEVPSKFIDTVGNNKFEEDARTDESSVYAKGFIPIIKPLARELLRNYSGLSPEEIDPHVLALRNRAFKIRPYPCIGQLRFLALSLSQHPLYSQVVRRVKQGDNFLDVGCCFGQELRKLSSDGAPSSNLYGIDLEPSFVEFGFELFRDRDRLKSTFLTGDMFVEEPDGFAPIAGKIDIIWASSFFHLFDWDDQLFLCKRVSKFLKQKPGSVVMGRQLGSVVPGCYPLPELMAKMPYWHDTISFSQLWDEVGKCTGTKWKVEATLDNEELNYETSREWGHPAMRRLLFIATLENVTP